MASAPPPRPRLVVLFGGRSAEHDVSCVSARHVLAAVDPARYDVEPVGITRDGDWVLAEGAMKALAEGADGLPESLTADGPVVDAIPMLSGSSSPAETADEALTVVLPILHGPMGEDGTVQGLMELAGVPYVGAGVLASALCMDKVAANNHLAAHGLPQAGYRWLTVDDETHGGVRRPDGSSSIVAAEVDDAIEALGLPLFVKPANMGSSIGVSRATDRDATIAAVELAASYDRVVVVEEAIDGREIEVAVLGNESPEASVAGEIVPGADFYDYDDKYEDGAELLIPAPLEPDELATMQRLAIAAYRALHVEGLARVDFFYEPDGRGWLVNELNTMPGFTPISQYPKLWAASGLDYPSLINRLVDLAIERHDRDQGHTRTDH
ncbi:MAG: D-alanine--D-alanine ligase [Acidimicrobiales bacterium]|jgi:D-alanine-D-alanine ligase|nr:D-alanine--D-alanine ligase [Acidimicrobiales bacterium]